MARLRKFLIRSLIVLAVLVVTSPLWVNLVARLAEPAIRTQLLGLAAQYVKPTLTVEKFEYIFPFQVKIINPKLTADGPDGKPVDIMTADEVSITLDRLPIFGGPLVFRDLDFENPIAKILVTKTGNVIGWGDFIKDDSGSDSDSSDDDRPISDIFAIDRINVTGLDFEYMIEGYDNPMVLKDLEFSLDNRGKNGSEKVDLGRTADWYEIDTRLTQGDMLDFKVNAGVDIDKLDVELTLVKLDLTLDEKSREMLPPQAQSFLSTHNVDGKLDVELKGTFNMNKFLSSKTKMDIKLGPTHFAIDSLLFSIDEATASGRTDKKTLLLEPIVVKSLGGKMTGTLRFSDEATRGEPGAESAAKPPASTIPPPDLTKASPESMKTLETNIDNQFITPASFQKAEDFVKTIDAFASVRIEDMKIQDLRRVGGGPADQYAGEVDAAIEVDLNLAAPLKSLKGGGTLRVSDGVLTGTDAWKHLATLMRLVVLNPTRKDRADLQFTVDDEKFDFSKMNILAGSVGVRAKGTVGFDGSLHLDANAGPLEAIQDSAGDVGSILGLITDRLVKYIIRGKIGDTTVRVAPFGINFRD
ncbi:MAG: hypothetical protein OSA40_09025 [Phycisphaerales bacterium]|nr:hypothetical protein [Phycisphaerales bacterium]